MGMFDWVNYECTCPNCHKKVDGFQTKSRSCEMKVYEPTEVENFYSSCENCGCWIEFNATKVKIVVKSFEMTCSGKNENKTGSREILKRKKVKIKS
jgi:hypothetical protein